MTTSVPAPAGASPELGWSIARAADRIGASPSALRSWEQRYGLRPSARTVGGHRRYTVTDIANLQRLKGLIDSGVPTAAAAATTLQQRDDHIPVGDRSNPTTPRTLAGRFNRAADALDAVGMAHAAGALLDAHGAVEAWTAVFAPYLVGVGRRWATTGEGVECEHLAVGVLSTVLDRHTWNQVAAGQRPTVLLIATETEGHTLPLYAAAAALAEHRIGTRVLGSLPADSVHAARRLLAPSAVLLFSRSAHTSDSHLLTDLLTAVPVVCAAGPGWAPRSVPAAVTHVNDLAGTVDHLTAWMQ